MAERDAVAFSAAARELLDGKNFASVATIGPDGAPQASVVWVKREGDAVLFSTTATRQKARNLARDARVAVSIFDLANPYRSIEIRGRAELVDDRELTLPTELSRKYLGEDPLREPAGSERLVVRILPEKVIEFSP
jgi:PPOX class probable F420-dependent enzyme